MRKLKVVYYIKSSGEDVEIAQTLEMTVVDKVADTLLDPETLYWYGVAFDCIEIQRLQDVINSIAIACFNDEYATGYITSIEEVKQ